MLSTADMVERRMLKAAGCANGTLKAASGQCIRVRHPSSHVLGCTLMHLHENIPQELMLKATGCANGTLKAASGQCIRVRPHPPPCTGL